MAVTLHVHGINCGGCGNAVRNALMAVEGVAEVVAEIRGPDGELGQGFRGTAGQGGSRTLGGNQERC